MNERGGVAGGVGGGCRGWWARAWVGLGSMEEGRLLFPATATGPFCGAHHSNSRHAAARRSRHSAMRHGQDRRGGDGRGCRLLEAAQYTQQWEGG